MGDRAIVETNDGKPNIPSSAEEWARWVSASATRNFVLGDPLLDWLRLYGADHGYQRDDESPTYDERADFTAFILEQGNRFESAVVNHLRTLTDVVVIANEYEQIRDLDFAKKTYQAMVEGVPIIHQGVLRDPENSTYGAPDLLIRSDVLLKLFPDCITESEAAVMAPELGNANWHYRVVDVKFTTCHLLIDGSLGNTGSAPAYKIQLFIYNRALGRIQGYEPESSFLLARGWEQSVNKVKTRGTNCLEQLIRLPQSGMLGKDKPIATAAKAACDWIREVRNDGDTWRVTPEPTRRELYPNSANQQDGPWHKAKHQIATELEDLTLLWQVGVPGRNKGHESGVLRWTDPRCTPAILGVSGDKKPDILQALLDINRDAVTAKVMPERITTCEEEWRPEPALEFYVDFETVNDLADDFSQFPERGGQALIFMVGSGHVENGEWKFTCFVSDRLDETSESKMIDDWLAHMQTVKTRLSPDSDPKVIHWSPAEDVTFEKAYNSAQQRHPEKDWASPNWFDFLGRVVREEPVVIHGAMGFGLKAFAKALHEHGLIETSWADGSVDGMGAMVGAWWCHEEAVREGNRLIDIDMMKEIVDYNEVDCKVRKQTTIPYLAHVVSVSALVLEFGGDENQAIAGLLHDTAEDAGGQARIDDIAERFGNDVAAMVAQCSDSLVADPSQKAPWRERKENYIAAIAHNSDRAILVTGADKLHNARAILLDYRTHGEDLWSRFNPDAGRDGTLWYYRSLVEALGERLCALGPVATTLADELTRTVNSLHELVAQQTADKPTAMTL